MAISETEQISSLEEQIKELKEENELLFEQLCVAQQELEKNYYYIQDLKEQAGNYNRKDKPVKTTEINIETLHKLIPAKKKPALPCRAMVLCYVANLSQSGGSSTLRTQGLARGFAQNGYEVSVVSEGENKENDFVDGIYYHYASFSTCADVTEKIMTQADELEKIFHEMRPRVIIAMLDYDLGIAALIAARRLGIFFVFEVRGLADSDQSTTKQAAENNFTAWSEEFCRYADHVFAISNAIKNLLIGQGSKQDHISLLPNGCDAEFFKPLPKDRELARQLDLAPDAVVIGYTGPFTECAALPDLAIACGMLKQRGFIFRLVALDNGDSPQSENIKRSLSNLAAQYEYADWLKMPEIEKSEDLPLYYSLFDIAAFNRKPLCELSNELEPLQIMASGKAVIAASSEPLREIIQNEKTGMYFIANDIRGFAQTLQNLLANPQKRKFLGANGRDWICAERTWRHICRLAEADLLG